MQHLSMVIITVEIFGSEIEQKLSKGRILQFSWNEKNYHAKNEIGELFSIFDPQPFQQWACSIREARLIWYNENYFVVGWQATQKLNFNNSIR